MKDELIGLGQELLESTAEDYANKILENLPTELFNWHNRFQLWWNEYQTVFIRWWGQDQAYNPLDPKRGQGKIDISALVKQRLADNNLKTNFTELIEKSKEGIQLISSFRQFLTGQRIPTKFLLIGQDRTAYLVDESDIEFDLKTVGRLSMMGTATVSSPLEFAYQMDDLVQELLNNQSKYQIDDMSQEGQVLSAIYTLKERRYKSPIWFDNKDAEIFLYFIQQKNFKKKSLEALYQRMRDEVGGGGGHRISWVRSGDQGEIQMKFMDISKKKSGTIIYAKFTTLRNTAQKIIKITESNQLVADALKHLKKIYVEQDIENGVAKKLDKAFAEEANKVFDILIKGAQKKKIGN